MLVRATKVHKPWLKIRVKEKQPPKRRLLLLFIQRKCLKRMRKCNPLTGELARDRKFLADKHAVAGLDAAQVNARR